MDLSHVNAIAVGVSFAVGVFLGWNVLSSGNLGSTTFRTRWLRPRPRC